MSRVIVSTAVVVLALLLQITVVNRAGLLLDLVMLAVVCLAVVTGSYGGTILGFAAGLAADLVPPADHVIGHHAMVYCLVGHLAGRAGESARHPILAAAMAAVGGVLLNAAAGLLLGDGGVTGGGMARALPPAVISMMLVAPLALWMATRVSGERGAVR